ncbi:MAG TPA: MerR family transcriptional regulator [Blastocatellia bacterium]|nr:MerR family transcriptional regulator [Blastocatellia bacterium]
MWETKPPSTTAKYMIGTVTKRTGLSVDVVRVWERRYGAIRPERTEGGTRLYSDADVSRLNRLRRAVELGHSIGQAARLSESDLDELIATSEPVHAVEPDPHRSVRERFLRAIQAMDVATAEKELTLAATLHPTSELVKKIVAPILHEVGERWAHRELGVAHEHLATGLLRGMLSSLMRLYSPSTNGEGLVLATLPEERHEFGLLLAGLLAATKSWRVIYLGAEVPPADLALAVRLTGARALALSIPTSQPRTNDELEVLSRLLPSSTLVWLGGAAAIRHVPVIARANWILIRDLDDLEDRL